MAKIFSFVHSGEQIPFIISQRLHHMSYCYILGVRCQLVMHSQP